MRRGLLFWMLLLLAFPGKSQTPFARKVWSRFYELVTLHPTEQLVGFQDLQNDCIRENLITDSTYTNLLFLFAAAQFSDKNPIKAISLLNDAIRIGKKYPIANPIPYLSKYYFYLGYYESQIGNFEEVIQHYNQAYELGVREFNKWNIPAMACHSLSHLYYGIQDYERGLRYAMLGADLAKERQDFSNLTKNLYEQCVNLYELDRLDEAAQKADSLQLLAVDHSTSFERGIYYKLFGDIQFKKHQYSSAEYWFNHAANMFKEQGEKQQLGAIYSDLFYLNELTNNREKSLSYENLAFKYTNDPYQLSILHGNKAFAYKKRGFYKKALQSLQKSLTVLPISFKSRDINENPTAIQLKQLPQKDYAFTALLEKAQLFTLLNADNQYINGGLERSLHTYLLLDTLADYIRWQYQGAAAKLFWREKLTNLYEQALEICFQLNQADRAFYFLEKSRAVLLLDQLRNNAAMARIPPTEIEEEAALRMTLNAAESSDLTDFLLAQAKLEAYVKHLEHRYPFYYRYKYSHDVPQLSIVQSYLKENDQSLLTYFEGRQAIFVLAVNKDKLAFKKINAPIFYHLQERLISFLHHPDTLNSQFPAYLQLANQFYQFLLKPFNSYLTKRIIVSTDGKIIPFAALSTSPHYANYLVKYYAFSYVYSAGTLLNSDIPAPLQNGTPYYLGLAPINFSYKKTLVSLSGAEETLKESGRFFHNTLLLTHEKANSLAFEQYWPKATVVQIITHANANQESTEPLLYLADKHLSVTDIQQTQAVTRLIVLAACRTGVGKNFKGEGIFSLSRGFSAVGIPSVVSTLWNVSDQAAYVLSNQYLQAASRQVPLDLALQQSQQSWLTDAAPGKQLPTSWAGIVILGSSAPLPQENVSFIWLYALVSLLLLSVLWLLVKKRFRK